MNYRIVSDSCCDLNKQLEKKMNIGLVPLKINIDGKTFVDDEKLDVNELLLAMRNTKNQIKTSSPSPGDFLIEYEKADNIFVVTLSSKLSGTHNSAALAKNIVIDDNDKFIHVFDSKSAAIGQTLISMKIFELIQEKCSKFDIVAKVEKYIEGMKTFFILDNLDNLINNGRLSKIAGHIASFLSIKPIMSDDGEGNIKLVEKVRGTKKAFRRLVEIIGEEGEDIQNKVLGICHCNALEKANKLKEEIKKRYDFKDIVVVESGGLTSVYANEGGIVVAF